MDSALKDRQNRGMDTFVHRGQFWQATQFDPTVLPWPEGVLERERGGWLLTWHAGVTARIDAGDWIVFRLGKPFAVYTPAQFTRTFARVEVVETLPGN